MIKYYTVQYSIIHRGDQYSTVQYNTVQYRDKVLYSTVLQYSIIHRGDQYSTVQYNTVQYRDKVLYSTVLQYSIIIDKTGERGLETESRMVHTGIPRSDVTLQNWRVSTV